ncbi:hypothetical protein AVEN_173245-1 [Araneus ventricosus]|uniref:Uncharacterized protein n=1 Tax=Araneus ventricosus TaxID=182803 RepID=A0A4Y2PK31_ARAVE|nr:hypothetical protein AVEN_173245-1 [Araneus ventricosus]
MRRNRGPRRWATGPYSTTFSGLKTIDENGAFGGSHKYASVVLGIRCLPSKYQRTSSTDLATEGLHPCFNHRRSSSCWGSLPQQLGPLHCIHLGKRALAAAWG